MKGRLHIIAVLAFATNCTRTPVTSHEADVNAVQEDQAQWLKDFQSKDLDKIVSHFSDDAIIVDNGDPPVRGREAAKNIYRAFPADPASSLTFSPSLIEVSKSGDLAYVVGTYSSVKTVPQTQKTAEQRGSYVSIYKKQTDGTWKDVADIGASELPSMAKQ
jgi:uncharacterized protein (TIGR02246 family)